jgi:hypothetical protein
MHQIARSQPYAFRNFKVIIIIYIQLKERKDTVNSSPKTIKQQPEQLERQLCPKTLLAQVAVWLGKSRSGFEQSSR